MPILNFPEFRPFEAQDKDPEFLQKKEIPHQPIAISPQWSLVSRIIPILSFYLSKHRQGSRVCRGKKKKENAIPER